MTGTTIRLQGCRKAFSDGTVAVHDLNLTIEPGETLAILGPSGCGKTTTLRLIAGLERPDSGQVWFGDEDVTRVPIERRDVGMVFQNYALFPNLNVADNVAYGLKVRGMPPAERHKRCAELLELVGLGEHGQRGIHELSGGQRQRVALARALAPRPRVLLLDEPLAALDAQLRERLRSELDQLLRSLGITSVFVTHDQGEAMALGDRILVMEQGRIAQLGSPREIYQKPANPFVAGFVGNLNAFAVLERTRDGLKVSGGELPWSGSHLPVTVYCRPEHLRVMEGDGHLRGRLLGQFFQGAQSRLLVDIGGAQPLLVDSTDPQIHATGASIALAIEPQTLFTLHS
ncbi:ABC transporter ATP-binding protein [Pseudomonas gingeri]|uniref:ABC transporter ATP-binding protein n=1 Tax=Pseudomonas gingeri TaxID=117681 RepID=UPI0015A4AAAB|nr:ABC transporter ATP-binding protein [Pseudomonas gingeri]NWD04634.1 ABC transporter ATP-binding protein [Pseudomonas gingeri]NWD50366.1 ABC transporter ATP-binding protein [Pseudomonas gingeri]NWE31000.1 ABC transporter ATP-binding protein [Pseudomonas gingeri]NWE59062.1 ABC transporter ATP-binding protein [Pseudomonas gingeri]NWF02350.1 ABC transporter ATP-binding protein [Pseudomonas gingeri]